MTKIQLIGVRGVENRVRLNRQRHLHVIYNINKRTLRESRRTGAVYQEHPHNTRYLRQGYSRLVNTTESGGHAMNVELN